MGSDRYAPRVAGFAFLFLIATILVGGVVGGGVRTNRGVSETLASVAENAGYFVCGAPTATATPTPNPTATHSPIPTPTPTTTSTSPLPVTGASITRLIALGVALVAVGGLTLLLARRRRTSAGE